MVHTVQVTKQPIVALKDENILVVNRATLFPDGAWHGIRTNGIDSYVALIQNNKQFIPRSRAETDPHFKQIIPYIIFMHKDTIFLMQRCSDSSEVRLQNKLTLGIGGHIRKEDMAGGTIFDWAQREFHEEVEYRGSLEITTIGLLNDDSNEVGEVHLGLVLLAHGNSPAITIKSELKNGTLIPLQECATYKDRMESWSALVYENLINSLHK